MNWDALDPEFLGPAFFAGLLVLSTHVPLGRQVLARGIIFIDLAVAQCAGLGVIIAHSVGWEPDGWAVQAIALGAALAGSLIFYVLGRKFPDVQEALIGVVFVLAATASLLLLSGNPHGGEHLRDLLTGQILWVSYGQLVPVALLYAAVLSIWFLWGAGRTAVFYGLFALAITAGVQLVGIYLVFASLIVPALAVRRRGPKGLWYGYLLGALGYGLGLTVSALWDLPSGPAIVWVLALGGCASAVLARFRRSPFHRRISVNR